MLDDRFVSGMSMSKSRGLMCHPRPSHMDVLKPHPNFARRKKAHFSFYPHCICFNFSYMLAQKFRTSSEISELNETQSLQAVKSMLQVSLQEIAWSRSFLPKSMFIEKKMAGFADVKIHQLHSSDSKPAKMFETWMQNISDLLKSNRLSSIIFGVHDDVNKPDEFSEMFHFHIEDTGSFSKIQTIALSRGSSSTKLCSSGSKEDVRSSATSMIRSLETLLGTLPAPSSTDKFMSIKLIARDGSLSSQDFSEESGFSCGMQLTCVVAI
jgi:hypothetical protein